MSIRELPYGIELILDLKHCKALPVSRGNLASFLAELCEVIEMEPEDLHFWDYEHDPAAYLRAPAHLKGRSAVQFIRTSTIVVHTLDKLQKVYINIFSCKKFDANKARVFCERYFDGENACSQLVERW